MKVWTHKLGGVFGGERSCYWRAEGTDMLLLEYPDGQLEWRGVLSGQVIKADFAFHPDHKGALLDPLYYPEWYEQFETCYVDDGI